MALALTKTWWRTVQPILTMRGTMAIMLSLERQNKWREQYRAEHPGWQPATEVFAGHVRRRLRPDSWLLDVGCGRGGLVEQLGHDTGRTVGVDPDYTSLREHRLAGLPRAVAMSDGLPFARDSFDLAIAGWLLEHLADPASALTAIQRVLRPGGWLVFVTPNGRHPLGWANRLAGRLGRAQGQLVDRLYGRAESDTFPTAYRANTPQTLGELARQTGYSVAALDTIADPSYLAFNEALFRVMCTLDDRLPDDRRIHIVGVFQKMERHTS